MENFAIDQNSGDKFLDLSEERARDLLYVLNASSIVAFTDFSGKITYVNDKFCEISKYSREELLGKNHRIINSKHHSKEFWIAFWDVICSGKIWKGEVKNKAKDGTFYWLFTTVIPLFNDQGKVRQFVSIRNEITEHKNIELENYSAQLEVEKFRIAQEAGERFVSMLAHDLRTPLTSAKLFGQLIIRQADCSEQVKLFSRKIVEAINCVDNMISHLLDSNKIRLGDSPQMTFTEFDLGKDLELTLETMRVLYGDRFIYKVVGNLNGNWDQDGLRRVTENLCSNAIKYGSAKNPVHVDLIADKSQVSLAVSNDGVLLSEDDQKSIFQYMHRSSTAISSCSKGWGIGLAKVREVAEANGGSVEIQSTKEVGTRFLVRLPRNIDCSPAFII